MQNKPDISKSNTCPPLPSSSSTLDTIIYWLGIGLGSGKPKKAPGTWGSLGGMIVGMPILLLGFTQFLVVTVLANIIGIWICDKTSKIMNVHDDPHIVFDEWAGIWIAMIPMASLWHSSEFACIDCNGFIGIKEQVMLGMGVVTFILFRLFDIIKPFPIGYLDKKLDGGLGIMLDDTLAGLFTLAAITLLMMP